MSVEALGGYIRELRTRQGLSSTRIGKALQTNSTYVWRIEHGKVKEPGAPLLAGLLREVNANVADALMLLLDPRATVADGQAHAQAWLAYQGEGTTQKPVLPAHIKTRWIPCWQVLRVARTS